MVEQMLKFTEVSADYEFPGDVEYNIQYYVSPSLLGPPQGWKRAILPKAVEQTIHILVKNPTLRHLVGGAKVFKQEGATVSDDFVSDEESTADFVSDQSGSISDEDVSTLPFDSDQSGSISDEDVSTVPFDSDQSGSILDEDESTVDTDLSGSRSDEDESTVDTDLSGSRLDEEESTVKFDTDPFGSRSDKEGSTAKFDTDQSRLWSDEEEKAEENLMTMPPMGSLKHEASILSYISIVGSSLKDTLSGESLLPTKRSIVKEKFSKFTEAEKKKIYDYLIHNRVPEVDS